MSDILLVYAVEKVRRRHHLKDLRPVDVDVAEARICHSWDDARAAMLDMSQRHLVVSVFNMSDPVMAAQVVHCGMVAS